MENFVTAYRVSEKCTADVDNNVGVQSHSGNWNVQHEYKGKCDTRSIQENPFGVHEVLHVRAITQRHLFSRFNHSELFNQQRYGGVLYSNISLMRNGGWVLTSSGGFFPFMVPFSVMHIGLQRIHLQILQAQRHMSQVCIPPHGLPRYTARFCNWVPVDTSQGDQQQIQCEVCNDFKRRNIKPIPFHCCVEDRVTLGFRGPSPAGPIERPGKSRVQVAS
ncbi:hypothetical protein SUGI_0473310 [Cryptomeria japonica]|nr:hypothetical protein SUGI_0473310 [Cryptomeria japonica]